MRTGVVGPTTRAGHPDHMSDCKAALEDGFRELIMAAEEAGWDRRDADWAIMLLAGDDLKAANAAAARRSQALHHEEDAADQQSEEDLPELEISLDEADLTEPD